MKIITPGQIEIQVVKCSIIRPLACIVHVKCSKYVKDKTKIKKICEKLILRDALRGEFVF